MYCIRSTLLKANKVNCNNLYIRTLAVQVGVQYVDITDTKSSNYMVMTGLPYNGSSHSIMVHF